MQSSHQTILILSDSYYQTRVNTFFQSSYQTLLTPWGSYSQTILNTFQDIKQYWNFQRVTVKQYYTLYQSLHQTILTFPESYWQTILHTFPELTSNHTDISKELLANNTTHFSRVYTKQYWHFQRVPSKLNYSKRFFQNSYHTILTLSASYYQKILTYLELRLNSNHTFTELLPSSSKHFFEVSMDTWTDKKFLKKNSQVKV